MKRRDAPTDPDLGLVYPLDLIGRSARPMHYDPTIIRRVIAVGCGLSPAP